MEIVREYEGTWEEIAELADELAGHRVRLKVLSAPDPQPPQPPVFRPGSGESVLRSAGTWVGDDLEECLNLVYTTRSKAKF